MNCPNCSADAGSGKFCRSCGSPLTTPKKIVCSGCGTEILSTTKFCAKCGTRAAAIEATAGQSGQSPGPAPGLEVVQSAAAPKLSQAPTAPALPTQSLSRSGAPSSVPPSLQPLQTVAVTAMATPVPVEAFPAEPQPEPSLISTSGRKPIFWAGGVLVIAAVAVLAWWFGVRTPPVNNAPIVKGPLYDQPVR